MLIKKSICKQVARFHLKKIQIGSNQSAKTQNQNLQSFFLKNLIYDHLKGDALSLERMIRLIEEDIRSIAWTRVRKVVEVYARTVEERVGIKGEDLSAYL